MIYTFVLTEEETIYLFYVPDGWSYRSYFEISLLQVCRQVHTETCLLPYKLNTFECCSDVLRCEAVCELKTFLAMRSEAQIAVLSRIRIDGSRLRTAAVWQEKLRGCGHLFLDEPDSCVVKWRVPEPSWFHEDDDIPLNLTCIHGDARENWRAR